jgi:structural maintenance of chromosome 4
MPDLKHAAVYVHFCEVEEDGGEVREVEGSELVVSRSVEKMVGTDKSSYMINGRASTFTEVTTMLKDKGIDLDHKRFLILQVITRHALTLLGRS